MNDIEILLALVEREPRCDVYAACLIDALIEDKGMNPVEATRHVLRVQLDARTNQDIDFTADLLARRGTAYHALLQEVEREAKLWGVEAFTIYIVGGDQPPSCIDGNAQTSARLGNTRIPVRLPAGWVRTWWEKNKYPLGNALPAKAHRPRRYQIVCPVK